MGFGLLFIGCFIAYLGSLSGTISAFTYSLGAIVILFSLRKLIYEGKLFIASAVLALALEITSLTSIGIQVFSGSFSPSPVMLYLTELFAYLFITVMMIAIALLAKEVELSRLSIMAFVNVGLIPVSGVLFIICEIIKNDDILPWISLAHVVLKLGFVVFSLVIIFGAYMRICYEGDEKMQEEKTGFLPFDKLNELSNKAFSSKPKTGKGGKK